MTKYHIPIPTLGKLFTFFHLLLTVTLWVSPSYRWINRGLWWLNSLPQVTQLEKGRIEVWHTESVVPVPTPLHWAKLKKKRWVWKALVIGLTWQTPQILDQDVWEECSNVKGVLLLIRNQFNYRHTKLVWWGTLVSNSRFHIFG